MSQAGIINVAGGGGGGAPIQTLTGDSGGAVPPTANNINVLGGQSTVSNTTGITFVGTPGTSTLTGTLTNRIPGTAITTDATTATTLVSFPLGAVAGTYLFQFKIVAFAKDTIGGLNPLSSVYNVDYSARTTGATASLFGLYDVFLNEEGIMSNVNVVFSVTFIANTLTIRVNGLANKTIDWLALGDYQFVS